MKTIYIDIRIRQTDAHTSCDGYSLAHIHHSSTTEREKQVDNLIPQKYFRLLQSHVTQNLEV